MMNILQLARDQLGLKTVSLRLRQQAKLPHQLYWFGLSLLRSCFSGWRKTCLCTWPSLFATPDSASPQPSAGTSSHWHLWQKNEVLFWKGILSFTPKVLKCVGKGKERIWKTILEIFSSKSVTAKCPWVNIHIQTCIYIWTNYLLFERNIHLYK